METKKTETRKFESECRAFENKKGKRSIEGYAILWGRESKLIYENGVFFYEIIKRGAADKVLANTNINVKYTYNHSVLIARTKSGTLKLISDEKGLKYIVENVPNTSDANDLYERIKSGDVFESSFVFMVSDIGQNWTKRSDGANLRTISEFSYLEDVSSVIDGAYANTEVAVRSLNEFLKLEKDDEIDYEIELKEKELEILKMKT